MIKPKILYYLDNFKFSWGEHDVVKWTKQILQNKFEIEEFREEAKNNNILFFDEFTNQKDIDKLKTLSKDNKIILVFTEYFTKFKNFNSLNYFEKRRLSFFLTKIAYFTNLINILISLLRYFDFNFNFKRFFKLTIFFLLFNFYSIFIFKIYSDLIIQNQLKIVLSYIPLVITSFFTIIYLLEKILKFIIKFIEKYNINLNIDNNVYFLKRYNGIIEVLKYTDHIIFCDKNVENSFFKNFPLSNKFSKKYSTINFYEVIETHKFNPEKNKIKLNIFGEINFHREKLLNKILNFGLKNDKLRATERKKIFDNFIFKDFERKNLNSKIGIIIPKNDLNPYLSTGAIIRHYNNNSVPIFFNKKNNKEFYFNPDNCLIIQDEKKLFEIFDNFENFANEAKEKYLQLNNEAKNQNEIVLENLKRL